MSSQVAICTLYEGDYHFGLAALANSLYASGFIGDLWVGTRGGRPPWLAGDPTDSLELSNGMHLKFISIDTPFHFSHFKPQFMAQVLAQDLGADRVAYIDPDIVIKAGWGFFDDWTSRGIALVGDFYEAISEDHLYRHHWRDFAVARQQKRVRKLDRYYNGGFVSIRRCDQDFLSVWENLIAGLPNLGLPIDKLLPATNLHPYQFTDQDLLNASLECGDWELATLQPSAMDLRGQVGQVMCHMTPGAKPWRCGYFLGPRRFRERSHACRQYWNHVNGPIHPYTSGELALRKLDQKLAALFGKIYAVPGWKP